MGGSGEDRLWDLSDDLLRRILYFVPSKEAASTTVLSRRWGSSSLWRSSGAVNLAVEAREATFSAQEAFVHAAKAALDAADETPTITRLTLLVESTAGETTIEQFLSHGIREGGGWRTDAAANVVGDLVSHPAARRVEELRVAAVDVSSDGASLYLERENHRHTGLYALQLASSLPSSETLRVLDLTRCSLHLTAAAACFPLPRLATLRLRHCAVEPEVLRALLDAAPELTAVRLESLFFLLPPPDTTPAAEAAAAEPPLVIPVLRLSFQQAVTTLVLSLCGKESGHRRRGKSIWAIEIDAPRLQFFGYKGLVRRFMLRRPAAAAAAAPGGVARVDLHFLRDYDKDDEKETSRRVLFWQFLQNFTDARTLRIKVGNDLKDITAIGEARHVQYAFTSLERLELEGTHRPKIKTAAAAIANLLHCCPALGEIVLKLSDTVTALPDKDPRYGREFLGRMRKDGLGRYSYDDVPGIPGLSGRSFACLQRSLRIVNLQFRLQDNNSISSCLGLRLIKFFTDHARVLEEICVDTGNWRLNEHLSFNVKTQMTLAPMPISATASSIQNKNVADSSSEFSKNLP